MSARARVFCILYFSHPLNHFAVSWVGMLARAIIHSAPPATIKYFTFTFIFHLIFHYHFYYICSAPPAAIKYFTFIFYFIFIFTFIITLIIIPLNRIEITVLIVARESPKNLKVSPRLHPLSRKQKERSHGMNLDHRGQSWVVK